MSGHEFFPFLTPDEIYRQLTRGNGAGSLNYEQFETQREQGKEGERAEMVRSLANVIKTGWQGEAGSGAYGAAMPLAERMLENTAKLDHAQDLLSRQSGSFDRARNDVVPVSSDPPQMSVDEKFPFDVDHDKAVQDYQDSAQHNIAVYREYDGASHYNETNLPQEYHTVNQSGGNVSVEQPGDVIKVDEPKPGDSGPVSSGPYPGGGPGPGGYPGGPGGGPGGSGPYPGGPGPGGYPGPAGPGGSQTSPTDYRPEPTPSYPVPTYPSPGQSSPVSAAPGGFVGGYPGGGEFGPRGGGPGGSGGPGGGRGPGGAVRGPLAPGPGALAAEEAAIARRAAAQAAAGARAGGVGPMGAPVGGGRGKDDEDAEHKRKVLIEADGEDVFGSDVLTAPEVIGDDEYED